MHATSRESLAGLRARFERATSSWPAEQVQQVAGELAAMGRLLAGQLALRRALANPAAAQDDRSTLLETVLGGKVSGTALQVANDAVRNSWSVPSDLVDTLLELSNEAYLVGAEKDGIIDDVEDQLFRFGRILDASGELEQALGQRGVPVEQRLQLLDGLIGDRVQPVTRTLLDGVLRSGRSASILAGVEDLVELAARRRSRSVAVVSAPTELTQQQQDRLAATLATVYGRPIAVSVTVDPALLGGLKVQVGDDIIDGSVADKLAELKRRFAG